jgi:hypothetical protein
MLTPRLHDRSKRFFRGFVVTTGKSLLQERNDLKMCEHGECSSVLETAKVVVVEILVNTSRPMRRSVAVMKEHSCSLFGPF